MKIEYLRELIEDHFQKEEFDKSLDCCSTLFSEHPAQICFDDLVKKGLCHYKLDQNEEAIGCFDRALEIDPDNILVLTNKGVSLYNMGKTAEAFKLFGEVLHKDPNIFPAWYYIGMYNLDKFQKTSDLKARAILVNAYRHVLRMAPDIGGYAIHDPTKDRDYSIELFVMINDDGRELPIEEVTAL
jgi:tetratricopeptide (TPR) repeat protein